jgi:nucleotide-binding universal stress UspA family protein
MNNQILIPTDFSDCANAAVETAIKLAKQSNATVHFLTVYDLLPNQDLEQKKKFALTQIGTKYANQGVTIKTAYIKGKFIETINEYIKSNDINLLVMGSHGASGLNEIMIGSNTQKVVRHVHCPVLVIKEKLDNVDFKNIVFASDFSLKEKEVFERFLSFIEQFSNPHIHLVAVNTSSFFNQPEFLLRDAMKEFKNMTGEIPCTTNIQYNFNVEHGIEYFSETIDADLIVVSNYQKSMLRKLFVGSTVEALINHSKTPILSLDF